MRIAHYEIVEQLGAGGMGEVYRARDPKLGRDVAIKILPRAFLDDPERRARFEREARVLASINHPHIGAIYGVEDAEGYRALILELIDGHSLAERLTAAGGLPVDEALSIARQIAEALEAAHEKGIVHRDLKPANIMLTPAGLVKVVDFGLARLDGREPAGSSTANSPTLTYAGTLEGVILGTAVYLSPEQARGRAVDKRTDVWAFGCVLFEMLTGRRVFGRETVSDSIAAILSQEPDWSALPIEVPPRVGHLLRRCLTKDPRRRLHDIADARIEIEDAIAAPPASTDARRAGTDAAPARGVRWLPWTLLAVTALALMVVSWIAIESRGAAPVSDAVSFMLTPPGPVAFSPTSHFVAVSPDGRYIAFVAYNDNGLPFVWVRPSHSVNAQPLPGTENARHPFWSPDSRYIGFFSAGGVIRKVPVEGGPAQTLTAGLATGTGATWNRDGVILFSAVQGPIRRIAASGASAPAEVTTLAADQLSHFFPSFLPDGTRFLYYVRSADPEKDGIYLGSLDGDAPQLIVRASSMCLYSPSGHLLYVRDGALLAHPFDATTARLNGDPVLAAERVDFFPESGMAAFSVSDTGVLVFRNSEQTALSRLVWFDRTGKRIGEIGEAGPYRNPRLSPDGKRVAVELVDGTGNRDVWLLDLARGTPVRFTFDPGRDASPVWSADGRNIVWQGSTAMYLKATDGHGAEQRLHDEPWIPDDWLPDGSGFLSHGPSPREIMSMRWPGPDRTLRKTIEGRSITTQARVSPDGNWVAFATSDTGRFEVVVQGFPTPRGRWQVSTAGGLQPKWGAGGRELFYLTLDGRLVSVPLTLSSLVEVGKPQILFQTQAELVTGYTWHQYDVTSDGKRFLVNTGDIVVTPITAVYNWPALLPSRR
jgi:Tol biopolymer transport system component